MPRTHSSLSKVILKKIASGTTLNDLFSALEVEHERKTVYDTLFRLKQQGVVDFNKLERNAHIKITEYGQSLLTRVSPTKDGVWKIVIFDIPEKKRVIRNMLRSKLKTLGFKKWQGSIWISPYKLDPSIEEEFSQMADKLFVRLIKTTDINFTADLEQMFKNK